MKLHLGVYDVGNIVTQMLTDALGDDAKIGIKMVNHVRRKIKNIVGDRAYDTGELYDAAEDRGAKVVVPPIKRARVNRNGSRFRNRTVRRVNRIGRRRWQKEAGYHRQGKVENAFFRYKTIIAGRLRSRSLGTQETESLLACKILNQMLAAGRPNSEKIGS